MAATYGLVAVGAAAPAGGGGPAGPAGPAIPSRREQIIAIAKRVAIVIATTAVLAGFAYMTYGLGNVLLGAAIDAQAYSSFCPFLTLSLMSWGASAGLASSALHAVIPWYMMRSWTRQDSTDISNYLKYVVRFTAYSTAIGAVVGGIAGGRIVIGMLLM